ncbi:MAG TPA: hypothetical protein VGJ00_01690 [Rhabdochlamydiaceae bacterium]|jgi:hypothetical protein
MLTHSDLLTFNARGLFPLDGEEEEAYLDRVADLQNVKTQLSPTDPGEAQGALSLCREIFDADPDWVAIVEQQKGLSLWQGAVLWIQEDAQGNSVPFIQVSPRLRTFFLRKWYAKEEVIAHEYMHAIRLPLRSVRFEEVIAYRTSRSAFRACIGPLFRRPWEVPILLLAILCGWLGIFWDAVFYLQWVPWALCFFGLARLICAQWVFNRCMHKFAQLILNKAMILPLMARLTDKEIELFAKSSFEEIRTYASCSTQLRWHMLRAAYPFQA